LLSSVSEGHDPSLYAFKIGTEDNLFLDTDLEGCRISGYKSIDTWIDEGCDKIHDAKVELRIYTTDDRIVFEYDGDEE
jgi:hypothetical protein